MWPRPANTSTLAPPVSPGHRVRTHPRPHPAAELCVGPVALRQHEPRAAIGAVVAVVVDQPVVPARAVGDPSAARLARVATELRRKRHPPREGRRPAQGEVAPDRARHPQRPAHLRMESSPEAAVDHATDLGHVRRPGGRAGQRPDRIQPAGVRVVVGVVGERGRLRASACSGQPARRLVQQRAGAARFVGEHAGGAAAPRQRRLHGLDQAGTQGHRHGHPLLVAAREGAVRLVHRGHQRDRRPVRGQVRDDACKVGGVLRHAIRAEAAATAAAVRRERRRRGVGEGDEVPHAQGRRPAQHVASGRVGGPVIRAAAAQVSRRKPGGRGDRTAAADVVAVLRQVQAGGREQQPRDPAPARGPAGARCRAPTRLR